MRSYVSDILRDSTPQCRDLVYLRSLADPSRNFQGLCSAEPFPGSRHLDVYFEDTVCSNVATNQNIQSIRPRFSYIQFHALAFDSLEQSGGGHGQNSLGPTS